MIPLCSSIEDDSNLSASVFNQSSDCCIRAGLQIWWGCHSPSKKIFFAGLCLFMIETEVNDGPGSDNLNASCNQLRYEEIISFDNVTGLKIT